MAAVFAAASAWAVRTDRWEIDTPAAFMKGKLQHLSVTSDGELRLGCAHQRLGEYAKEIWSAVAAPDGTIYFGGGSPASVFALGRDGQVKTLFATESIAVTALALDGKGHLFAGTLAEGRIFRIPLAEPAKAAEFAKLDSPYVWSLVVDKDGDLLAGTGPDGKVFRVHPNGETVLWYTAEDSNILCLLPAADGALLAGGSDRGQVYRITARQNATVLHQFEEDEVHCLAWRGDELLAGVNKVKVRRPRSAAGLMPAAGPAEGLPRVAVGIGGAEAAGGPGQAASPGRPHPGLARAANLLAGALYVRRADGRVDQLAAWDTEAVQALAVEASGQAVVATAGKARVYRVVGDQRWEMLFDLDEQQALALALHGGKLAFVGTGNVGAAYRIDPDPAPRGEFVSEVLDAKFSATWGHLAWKGSGALQCSTRTGNTSLPDETWSDWQAAAARSPAAVGSPPGRYLQLKAELTGNHAPTLRSVTLHFRIQNQKPELTVIRLDGAADTKSAKPKIAGGDKDEGGEGPKPGDDATATAGPRPKPRVPHTTTKRFTWDARDKDGDTLVYRLFYRREESPDWIAVPLEKPLKKAEYAWDTDSIPDGWYRFRVEASDEEANAAGEALRAEKTSDAFKVDNRRPEIAGLEYAAGPGLLTGTARDDLSLIVSLEYAVDGGEWRAFLPKNGILDESAEEFAVKLPDLAPGSHTVAVRATDEEGNIGVESIAVRVGN